MKRVVVGILGSVGLAVLVLLVYLNPFGQRFERDFGLSSLYALRGPVAVPTEAIVIALGQQSVTWLQFHARDLTRASDMLPDCLRGRLFRRRPGAGRRRPGTDMQKKGRAPARPSSTGNR